MRGGGVVYHLDRFSDDLLIICTQVYVFPCERWLSKTEDDGALSRELVAVDRGDLERRRTRKMSRVSLNGKEVVAGGDDVDLEQKAETTTYNIEVVTGTKCKC